MESKVLLRVLLCGLFAVTCSETLKYHFVDGSMTWSEAQQICRTYYTDLVTINSLQHIHSLPRPASNSEDIWIGTSYSAFHKWRPGFPVAGDCAVILGGKDWITRSCTAISYFVCHSASGFHLVQLLKTWSGAQTYCRENFLALAIIRSEDENEQVHSLLRVLQPVSNPDDHKLWIRNHLKGWSWSDNSAIYYTRWLSGRPVWEEGISKCGVVRPDNVWMDVSCDLRRAAFCYQSDSTPDRIRSSTTVKMTLSSGLNMLDPIIYKRLVQKIEELLNQHGLQVTVTGKFPPKQETADVGPVKCGP